MSRQTSRLPFQCHARPYGLAIFQYAQRTGTVTFVHFGVEIDATGMGLAIGVSTLAVALPMALADYWREKDRAKTLCNLGQEYRVDPGDGQNVVSRTGQHATARS